jgi:hypothetical protein
MTGNLRARHFLSGASCGRFARLPSVVGACTHLARARILPSEERKTKGESKAMFRFFQNASDQSSLMLWLSGNNVLAASCRCTKELLGSF